MIEGISTSVTGAGEIVGTFQILSKIKETEQIHQALLDATMPVERAAKENLEEMVYSTPEGWYKRKKGAGLFGKTMGARTPVSDDGGVANPRFDKVEATSNTLSASCISLVHYAKIVHFGLGRGRNAFPRPFLTKALQSSKEAIEKILGKGMLDVMKKVDKKGK